MSAASLSVSSIVANSSSRQLQEKHRRLGQVRDVISRSIPNRLFAGYAASNILSGRSCLRRCSCRRTVNPGPDCRPQASPGLLIIKGR
ncbi:hypothetical protein BDW66DRAFT_61742 [Aspergillus desertorum]